MSHPDRIFHSWSSPPSTVWRCRIWWCQKSQPNNDLMKEESRHGVRFLLVSGDYTPNKSTNILFHSWPLILHSAPWIQWFDSTVTYLKTNHLGTSVFYACFTARQTDMTFPSTSFLTRVSSCVHRRTKQQQVLCDRGVEEAHGAHPTSGVHKHPLQVLVWQDVARIPKFSLDFISCFLNIWQVITPERWLTDYERARMIVVKGMMDIVHIWKKSIIASHFLDPQIWIYY